MKLYITLVIGLICSVSIFAQSTYEAGYFINNEGKKRNCLIKKLNWKDNPTEFQWKATISSSPRTESVETVKEFAVGEEYLFKTYIVEYDLSSFRLPTATKSKDPKLKIKKIFLRVLLESRATLFQYSENNINKYFFTNAPKYYPELLVYKVYYTPDEKEKLGEKIIEKENVGFRDQLKIYVSCGDTNFDRIEYNRADMIRHFRKYNKCKGEEITYISRKKINQTKFGIVAAADLSGFEHNSQGSNPTLVTYDNAIAPRYGLYVESFIPFSKLGLSFFLEGTYVAFKTEGIDPFPLSGASENLTLDYKNAKVAFAPRFHLYLSSKTKLFFEGGISVEFDLGSTSAVGEVEAIENVNSIYFYGGGFGVGKFKLGFRMYTSKNMAKTRIFSDTKLDTMSGYLAVELF